MKTFHIFATAVLFVVGGSAIVDAVPSLDTTGHSLQWVGGAITIIGAFSVLIKIENEDK